MSITTEDLVTSLLSIGYTKVDSSLFAKAKAIITTGKVFKFTDYSISKTFNNFIIFDGNSFKLSEGLSSSMILSRNEALTNYLKTNGLGISAKPKTRALVMKSSN